MEKHLLSKSTFIRGHQCLKSLYLYKKRYFLRDPLSDEQRLKFKRGHQVGEIAQQLFPGGVDVRPKSPSQYRKAVMKTRELIDEGAEVLYEAGFQYDRVLVFLDALFKRKDKWYGCEVKSSRSISDTYLLDAALQYHVITNSGINIDKFYIAHINEDYVLEDEPDINSLFMLVDVSEKILTRQAYIKEQIEREKATLELTSSPKIDVGPHCHDPYPCDFIGHCWKGIEKEVVSIEYDSGEIKKVVETGKGELAFLHLTSFRPAIPIYKGTRPYQEIPFQYSLMDKEGNMQSYLLPPGEHPDLLYNRLSGYLKGFDVIVTDARCKIQDARCRMAW